MTVQLLNMTLAAEVATDAGETRTEVVTVSKVFQLTGDYGDQRNLGELERDDILRACAVWEQNLASQPAPDPAPDPAPPVDPEAG